MGLPRRLSGKNPPAYAGDTGDSGSIPRSGRSPGEGNSKLLQYSCLENPMDRGGWWAIVHGVAKSDVTARTRACTRARAHTHTHTPRREVAGPYSRYKINSFRNFQGIFSSGSIVLDSYQQTMRLSVPLDLL